MRRVVAHGSFNMFWPYNATLLMVQLHHSFGLFSFYSAPSDIHNVHGCHIQDVLGTRSLIPYGCGVRIKVTGHLSNDGNDNGVDATEVVLSRDVELITIASLPPLMYVSSLSLPPSMHIGSITGEVRHKWFEAM
jgi:hypothetical protein